MRPDVVVDCFVAHTAHTALACLLGNLVHPDAGLLLLLYTAAVVVYKNDYTNDWNLRNLAMRRPMNCFQTLNSDVVGCQTSSFVWWWGRILP